MPQEQPYRPQDMNQLAKHVIDLAVDTDENETDMEDANQLAARVIDSIA